MIFNPIQRRVVGNSYLFCLIIFVLHFGMAFLRILAAPGNIQEYVINVFNATGFHWLISTTYLYWIYRNDSLYYHLLSKLRYITKTELLLCRIRALIKQTFYFLIPFFLIATLIVPLTQNHYILLPLLISFCNIFLGIFLMGVKGFYC